MHDTELYAVTGVSGRTGAAVAHNLLAAGKCVRVIVRDERQGNIWLKYGAEIMVADFNNVAALARALSGVQGAYIVSPPQYASNELFAQAKTMADILVEAAFIARLPKIVALSSVGAEKTSGTGWVRMNHMLEQRLIDASLPVTLLRAAYFMENWLPLVTIALEQGRLPSFLAPLNKSLPMIATADIGRLAAEALIEQWSNKRIIELAGPEEYSPQDLASIISALYGKQIIAERIPESQWTKRLSDQGYSEAALQGFIEMTQGLNSGHVAMQNGSSIENRKGTISLRAFINSAVKMESQLV